MGRFISQDTWRGDPYQPWTRNPYAYANNDPVNMVDPTGHVALPLVMLYLAYTANSPDTQADLQQFMVDISQRDWNDEDTYLDWETYFDLGSDAVAIAMGGVSSAQVKGGKEVAKGTWTWLRQLFKGTGKADAFSHYMKVVEELDVSTQRNQAVFWSGRGNRAIAEEFAKVNSKMTLEMTPGGKYLDSLKLFDNGSPLTPEQAQQVWSRLSQRFAQQASGTVIGFVQGARPSSIFNIVEYPSLLNNPNINNIFTGGY